MGSLAQKVRQKYPGAYDDLSDSELESKVLAKYPEYADLASAKAQAAPAQSDSERRAGQSFMQNWMENAGAMYEGEAEGAPAQFAGAATAAGMTLPGIAAGMLPVAAASNAPLVMGGVAGAASLAGGNGPVDALKDAALTYFGVKGSGLAGKAGKFFKERAAARAAAELAQKEKTAIETAAKLRTSTVIPAGGGATSTAMVPASVIPFPANPQQAAVAMRVAPRPAAPMPANPAEAAAAMGAPKAARAPKVQPDSSTLEQQLRETVKMSRGARKQLSQAQELEARIVEWKTRQGQSEAQIVDSLKKIFGIGEPGAAKEMVDLVLRTHGLK